MQRNILLILFLINISISASVPESFGTGPQIEDYGPNVLVEADLKLDKNQKLKVVFDVGEQGANDAVNRHFNSLARFINMHVRAGVKPENIHLAMVVHGKAAYDVMNAKAYQDKFDIDNPNQGLLNELLKNNVDIYLCGQTAAYYQVDKKKLHTGVKMSLSAMTAHALLQQQGYTLNPF